MSYTLDELNELQARRVSAVQQFLNENWELFSTQEGEIDLDEEDGTFDGPMVLDKWVLLVVERNLSAVDRNHFAYSSFFPADVGVHGLIGMLEMARDRER